jgi:hypothetical protein
MYSTVDKYEVWANTAGGEEWWLDGMRHRENGPAMIYPDGTEKYYLKGQFYSKEDFDLKMNPPPPKKMTVEDIPQFQFCIRVVLKTWI